jgi:transcriptional regulator/sugar kinase
VIGGKLNIGDNSCVETFCLPHPDNREVIIEDGAAIRAVKRVYGELSGNANHGLEPKDIAAIAHGEQEGNQEAAIKAFAKMGEVAAEGIRLAVTLMDGLVVIGGGIMGSHDLLMPSILKTLRGKIHTMSGDELDRVLMKVYNLDDDAEFAAFAKGDAREIKIYGSEETVVYDPQKRIGIMRSKIGASAAISLGAYAFALSKLDELSNN